MGLYYNDLVAAAKKDASSRNFLTLVDAAVSLFEEEEESVGLGRKGKDKCEEDRVFVLFPRKTRTYVFRRRQPKLLLHGHGGASTSSLLLDLNTVPVPAEPQNPLQWLDSKTLEKPRPFKRIRVIFGSKSRNPNSPKTSRKRCAEQETKPRGGSKKARLSRIVDPLLSWRGRDPPESIHRIMRHMNVTEQEEPKLIFERILYESDVKPSQGRLSMPISQVLRNDFLTPAETGILQQDINNSNKTGVDAFLLNQHSQRWDVKLKRWEFEGSWTYSVTCAWKSFVAANGLVQGHGISVWTFRSHGMLCFAVLPLHTMGQTSGYALPL